MCASMAISRNSKKVRNIRKMTINMILRISQETRKFLALIDYAAEKNFIS
jgi:hypothetical protein